MKSTKCPCGSGKLYSDCCEPYCSFFGVDTEIKLSETILFEWSDRFSPPIVTAFREKVGPYIYRISVYLDQVINQYYPYEFIDYSSDQDAANDLMTSIKANILHSFFASMSCLSQGLFLQSGSILRSLVEDCFVMIDIFEDKKQIEKVLQNKYSTNGIVSRIKSYIPKIAISWYGEFSANFVHFGPLHQTPYKPSACYADNWVLVIGLQNIVRSVVMLHIALERVYFNQIEGSVLWTLDDKGALEFNDDSHIFDWVEKLGKELVRLYPPDERKEGFTYPDKKYGIKRSP